MMQPHWPNSWLEKAKLTTEAVQAKGPDLMHCISVASAAQAEGGEVRKSPLFNESDASLLF